MTLRQRIGDVFVEHGADPAEVAQVSAPTGALIADITETVARWLECPDVRESIYEGLSIHGPKTKNVGEQLAARARRP